MAAWRQNGEKVRLILMLILLGQYSHSVKFEARKWKEKIAARQQQISREKASKVEMMRIKGGDF